MDTFACVVLVEGVCQQWQEIASPVYDPDLAGSSWKWGFGIAMTLYFSGVVAGFFFKVLDRG